MLVYPASTMNIKTNPDDHVFPGVDVKGSLTKREIFTLGAMIGFCANPGCSDMMEDRLAQLAVLQADAQIAALNKEQA
jgi:hypothetical protein